MVAHKPSEALQAPRHRRSLRAAYVPEKIRAVVEAQLGMRPGVHDGKIVAEVGLCDFSTDVVYTQLYKLHRTFKARIWQRSSTRERISQNELISKA